MANIRVASWPATHVYVRHLGDVRDDIRGGARGPVHGARGSAEAASAQSTVIRIADPSGDDLRTPSFADPAWWTTSAAADIDLLHVHFGFEYYDPDTLEAVCEAVHSTGRAIVYTCHDLRNPNHPTPQIHDAQLRVWLRHADEVVTLTPFAARRLREHYGRTATVIPHPHVVELPELRRRTTTASGRQHDGPRQVLLHLKSLRANMCGLPTLEAAVATIDKLASTDGDDDGDAHADRDRGLPSGGVRLRVHLHHDVLDPASSVHDAALVRRVLDLVARSDALCDLHVHHYLTDDELHELYAEVDVVVLPYRFGTHSGLIELCRDLGTRVVVPAVGGYEDQGAHHVYDLDDAGEPARASFEAALRSAILAPRPAPIDVATRVRERRRSALAHLEVYERALATARSRVVSEPRTTWTRPPRSTAAPVPAAGEPPVGQLTTP